MKRSANTPEVLLTFIDSINFNTTTLLFFHSIKVSFELPPLVNSPLKWPYSAHSKKRSPLSQRFRSAQSFYAKDETTEKSLSVKRSIRAFKLCEQTC